VTSVNCLFRMRMFNYATVPTNAVQVRTTSSGLDAFSRDECFTSLTDSSLVQRTQRTLLTEDDNAHYLSTMLRFPESRLIEYDCGIAHFVNGVGLICATFCR
jgi:hypothetical protein